MTGMPQGWAIARLDEVTTPRGEKADPATLGELPFLGMDHIEANTANLLGSQPVGELKSAVAVFKSGDLLYGRLRPYLNKVHLAGFDGAASAEFIVFPPQPAIEQRYLQCILRSPEYRAIADQRSTGDRPRVKFEDVGDYEIRLPPLPEQRRIVRKLDTLSARSTTARTHLTAIEKLVERYKASALISIFSGAATSEGMTTLDKVGRLVCGQSPASATVNRDGVGTPYCTGPEQWDGINVHLDKWTTDPKRIVDEESIFITVKGSGVGTLFPGTRCAIGRDVYAYVPEQGRLDWRFAFWALRYEIANILINVKGLIPGLSKPDILGNPVFVPCLEEQHEIVRRIETAFAKIDRLAAEAAKALKLLGHLDQRILAKAFAGDLVPQDPNDEPAETLLARVRKARAAAPKGKNRRKFRA